MASEPGDGVRRAIGERIAYGVFDRRGEIRFIARIEWTTINN
jgi:hypothetical protein